MNKKELIQIVYDKTDFQKKDIEAMVNLLFSTIEESLIKNQPVDIGGFGKFEIKERPERDGINPMTHERIRIASSKNVKFKISKSLKEKINE